MSSKLPWHIWLQLSSFPHYLRRYICLHFSRDNIPIYGGMFMIITTKLKVDLQTPGVTPIVHAVQNDSYCRNLEIALYTGGVPFVFPGNANVVIRYRKSDGKGGEYDTLPDGQLAWSLHKHRLTIALAPQVLTCPGSVALSIVFLQHDRQLSVFPVRIAVQPIASALVMESEDYCCVTNFLPAPQNAKAGQFFQVASVDETGRITGVAAVDFEVHPEPELTEADVQALIAEYMAQHPPVTQETDPTVPGWAKQQNKPAYTAAEVGADPAGTAAGATADHNSSISAHSDIRTELLRLESEKVSSGQLTEALNTALEAAEMSGAFDGSDGYSPVRGVDYWTNDDQEIIVQQVIAVLGTPVFGTVDAENNIILTGDLTDGAYTLKYEHSDGTRTEIGVVEIGNVIEYGYVYGRTQHVGGSDYSMYYDGLGGQTNYRLIYQTTGEVPFANGSISGEATPYYPLKVPKGKTKVKVILPSLAPDKSVRMTVDGLALSNGIYTRVVSSGWIAQGVYEYEFGSDISYIDVIFRNEAYSGLVSYDFTGFTVTWE